MSMNLFMFMPEVLGLKVAKWIDYFIYHKKVSFEKIEVRL
jgi:hypothetical protein